MKKDPFEVLFHFDKISTLSFNIAKNIHVKLMLERLGHSDIGTTLNTYSHVLPDMQRTIFEKLDEVFEKSDH